MANGIVNVEVVDPTIEMQVLTPIAYQSGGIIPSGVKTITSAGDTDVTSYETARVAAGSVSSPTATMVYVNDHSVTVTPSVSYSEGYIDGGSKSGTGVSVSASDLVSGTKNIYSDGNNIDVTDYAAVNVQTGGGGGGGITPTGNINIENAGYTDVTEYATAHVDAGSVSSPTATKGDVNNNSITITPSVSYSEGYIEGGSKSGTGVTVSASDLVSGTWSIARNGSGIDVTNYKYVDVDVPGGAGAPTILTGTDGATTSGVTEVDGPSITGIQPGTYNIYASFSAAYPATLAQPGSATFNVYVGNSIPEGFSTTIQVNAGSYVTRTIVKTDVIIGSSTNSLKITVLASKSSVHASAISLIAVKVG